MELSEAIRRLDGLAGGFQRSKILFTALDVDLFEHLKTPRTAGEVASEVGWHPRGARMLLDGLVALNLVEKVDGRYQNGEPARECLVEGAPKDQRHILRHKGHSWDTWARLDDLVKTGGPPPPRERSDKETRAFICGMNDIAKESAAGMVQALDLSGYRHMLDLGGGPATYSIAFLKANPALGSTVFDLPHVLPIGREVAEAEGMSKRISFIEGDMTTDAFGAGYDLVLASNIIHSWSYERNQEIVQKCFDAMEPGGLLIIKDFLLDSGRAGPAFGLVFALHMFVNTQEGDTYTIDDVAAWTNAAGFEPGTLKDLTPQSRLWLAKKPA